ncbi:helix-turn-helix domain-containing protein [Larkinella sp. C7]|uniref:helix-turn-helix domain-containing protein n=1 Tax=Larkinella sp. C7 TaxID=2576607 RepID=UPI001111515A|nr:helix-turn-helix domain-containing protein [Larkinella sp. C7]
METKILEEIRTKLDQIDKNTKLTATRAKLLFDVEDVAFLTGFSEETIYRWIRNGRPVGKKTIYLKPAYGIAERGHRIFPDELDYFLSHFPPARV